MAHAKQPERAPGRRRSTLAAVVVIALTAIAATSAEADRTRAAPSAAVNDATELQPPRITVLKDDGDLAPGLIFLGPKPTTAPVDSPHGPLIVDDQGRPVWFKPLPAGVTATDVRVQRYLGKPVLTWDEGTSTGGPGHSEGEDFIADRSYHVIARVDAGNGYRADQHEFRLTPQGTALITIYHEVPADLSSVGGPSDGHVLDGIVQEIDVRTGRLLFEWHSLDHVPLSDSYQPVPSDPDTPYDYFHINAVNPTDDGNLLISARHTSTVYKVDRHTGRVIWRLGGKESDFELGPGVRFAYQHDPLPAGPHTVRIFDNESNGTPVLPHSRVIWVHLDTRNMTATLERSIEHPEGLSAPSQGNAQALPNGDVFAGWGQLGRFSEFDRRGDLLFDASVPSGYDTYRAYRSPWTGEPAEGPTATAADNGDGSVTVDAIWNGATEVARWRVLAGSSAAALTPVGSAAWDGLDTKISVSTDAPYLAVEAVDARGRPIGRSAPTPAPG